MPLIFFFIYFLFLNTLFLKKEILSFSDIQFFLDLRIYIFILVH
jgi:hypothetical protein